MQAESLHDYEVSMMQRPPLHAPSHLPQLSQFALHARLVPQGVGERDGQGHVLRGEGSRERMMGRRCVWGEGVFIELPLRRKYDGRSMG